MYSGISHQIESTHNCLAQLLLGPAGLTTGRRIHNLWAALNLTHVRHKLYLQYICTYPCMCLYSYICISQLKIEKVFWFCFVLPSLEIFFFIYLCRGRGKISKRNKPKQKANLYTHANTLTHTRTHAHTQAQTCDELARAER